MKPLLNYKELSCLLKAFCDDPTFHGIDLEARFKVADEALKQANTNSEM